MRTIRNNKGFTLIELMIVVVIIGILAAIAIPRFGAVSLQAKQAEAAPILNQICTLAAADFQRNSTWPGTLAGAGGVSGWQDPVATYFTFTFAGTGTTGVATATPSTPVGTDAGVVGQTMDCVTNIIS